MAWPPQNLSSKAWWIAALISCGIALFEYLLQVPANRIGAEPFSLAQLKIMQEVITLAVFVPFAAMHRDQPMKLDFLWAGLCLPGAAYFVFRAYCVANHIAGECTGGVAHLRLD